MIPEKKIFFSIPTQEGIIDFSYLLWKFTSQTNKIDLNLPLSQQSISTAGHTPHFLLQYSFHRKDLEAWCLHSCCSKFTWSFSFPPKFSCTSLSAWINKSNFKSTHTPLGTRNSEAELSRKHVIHNKNWPYKTYCRETAPQHRPSRLLFANDCISLFNYYEWIRVSYDYMRSTCSLYKIKLELQQHSFANSSWWCWLHFPWAGGGGGMQVKSDFAVHEWVNFSSWGNWWAQTAHMETPFTSFSPHDIHYFFCVQNYYLRITNLFIHSLI